MSAYMRPAPYFCVSFQCTGLFSPFAHSGSRHVTDFHSFVAFVLYFHTAFCLRIRLSRSEQNMNRRA